MFFTMMTMMIIFHSDDLDNNIFYISSLFDCSGPPHPRLIPGNENDDDNGDDDNDDDDEDGDYVGGDGDGVVCGYEISINQLFCACAK